MADEKIYDITMDEAIFFLGGGRGNNSKTSYVDSLWMKRCTHEKGLDCEREKDVLRFNLEDLRELKKELIRRQYKNPLSDDDDLIGEVIGELLDRGNSEERIVKAGFNSAQVAGVIRARKEKEKRAEKGR